MATNIAAVRPDPATTNSLLSWLVDRESLVGPRNPVQELSFQFGLSNASVGSSGANDRAFVGDWSALGIEHAAVARANVGLGMVGVGQLDVGGTQVLLDTDRDGSAEYSFNVVLPGNTPVAGNRPVAGNFDNQFGDDIALTRTEVSAGVGYKQWYVVYAKGGPGNPFPLPTGNPAHDVTFSPHLALSSRTDANFSFGFGTDYELMGDVTGDGRDDIIAVRAVGPNLEWHIHHGTNAALPTDGTAISDDQVIVFGSSSGIPVLGNWSDSGNGVSPARLGVITNDAGFARWNVDTDGSGSADTSFVYGLWGDQFVVGSFPDVEWTQSQSSSWNTGANWSTGSVPGVTSMIGIDQPGINEVQHDTNTIANIGAIYSSEPINISSGLLINNLASNVAGLKISGGQLLARQNLNPDSFQMTAGTLLLGKSDPLGNVTLNLSGGQVQVPAQDLVAGNDFTLSNPIQISNTVGFGGTGIMRLNSTVTGTGNFQKIHNNYLQLRSPASYTGATLISQGELLLAGNELLPNNSPVDIAAGALLNLSQFNETVSTLSGAGNIYLGTGGANFTTTSTVPSTFAGDILGSGTVIKQGAQPLTISGALSMNGILQLSVGELVFNGAQLATAQMNVLSGAVLKGTGTTGITTIAGTLAPGQNAGILRSANLTLGSNANLSLEFGGTTAGGTTASYDQVQVTGSLNIASSANLQLAALNGFLPSPGQQFQVISNDGSDQVVGSFAGLPEGALIGNFLQSGWSASISYHGGDGNDVVLTVINRASTDINVTSTLILENLLNSVALTGFSTTDPDVHDLFQYSLVPGSGALDNAVFQIDNSGILRSVNTLDFETKSNYSIRVRSQDLAGNIFEKPIQLTVQDVPELIGLPVINDGATQRSLVTKISVTFDGPIEIASGAFAVKNHSTGVPVVSSYQATTSELGQTQVTLSFQDASTRGQVALNDGYYELEVDGSKIRRGTISLDSNRDGVTGDTYRFGASEADGFFALFGDTNADGLVGVAEFGQFRTAFGKLAEQPDYSLLFDYNLNGAIGIDDFGKFRERFGKTKLAF